MTPEERFAIYDQMGEVAVRSKLASLDWQGTEANQANAWLAVRSSSNALEALKIARKANNISIVAIICSALVAIITIIIGFCHRA
jgi:hypothetical protein